MDRLRWFGLVVTVVWLGCGDTATTAPDAGPDGRAADGGADESVPGRAAQPMDPERPKATASPTLAPCPEGWRQVGATNTENESVSGAPTCAPWPQGGRQTECASHEAHFPGEPGCRAVGSPCPSGRFAEELPTDGPAVVYVDPDAASGGDGSKAEPLRSVSEALSQAPASAVIALAKGRYEGAVRPSKAVTLWGACPAQTVLEGGRATTLYGLIRADRANVEVRNVKVTSGVRPGITAGDGAQATIEDVVIDGVRSLGLAAYRSGQLEARGLVVRDVGRSPDGTSGRGVTVEVGGQLTLERTLIENVYDQGIFVAGEDSSASLTDVAVVEVGPESSGEFGRGLAVEDGAQVQGDRVVVKRAQDLGVFALNAGTHVQLDRAVIRETRGHAMTGAVGRGLSVHDGARASLRQSWLDRNRDVGVYAYNSDSEVSLEDVVVSRTRPQQDGNRGRGFSIESGATLTGTRVELRDNRGLGGLVFGGSSVELTHARVLRTMPRQADGDWGMGLWAHEGTTLALNRAVLDQNHDAGLLVSPGAELAASDVQVRRTRSAAQGDTARGLGLEMIGGGGASASCERCLFEENQTVGMILDDGVAVNLVDTVVRGTLPRQSDQFGGLGVVVTNAAQLRVERVRLEDNRGTALFAAHEGTEVRGSDLTVTGTRANEPGPLRLFGRAMDVQEGAAAGLERVRFEDNETSALLLSGGTATFEDLTVASTRVDPERERFGRGIIAQRGSELTVRTGHLFANREVGVYVSGSTASLQDFRVEGTSTVGCSGDDCTGLATGIGLGVYRDSDVDMSQFLLSENELIGIHLAAGGVLDATDGKVAKSRIGVAVSTEGFDVQRITEGVAYVDNETNLDSRKLPVPDRGEVSSTYL
jgi:hypothetical protein